MGGGNLLSSPKPVTEAVIYEDAPEHEQASAIQLTQTADVLRNILVKPEVTTILAQLAQKQPDAEIKLKEAIEQNPELSAVFAELKPELLKEFTHDGVDYYPVLYVPNADKADFTLSPVVLVGTEAEVNASNCEDCIPGWAFDEQGNQSQWAGGNSE